MTETPSFKTEQETFWHGDFGNAYTDRNNGDEISRANLLFWGGVLKRTGPIQSCFEIGCNRGLNLDAIKTLLPACKTSGLEINTYAAKECARKGHQVFEGSILAAPHESHFARLADLSFASGVLIHIEPGGLNAAYDLLFSTSKTFILISEYFNPQPVAIPYRGHENRLFKRDFAGELWARYPNLRLVDYGFIWSKDPVAPKDDTTWFLFQK
jgi:pseudaminic acid biosynthesis-associated methylase